MDSADKQHRQFVACAFRPGDTRTYTYHFDGEPLAKGDRVVVSGKRGPSIVHVVSISDQKPLFETKPIVGKERQAPSHDALPDGLIRQEGKVQYRCRVCEAWTEWPAEIEEFDINDPHNVCGGSPRCHP